MMKSRRLRWAEHIVRMEENRDALKIVTDKPTRKRPLGRPIRRWEDNLKMDLKEMGINTRILVDSAQDRDYCRSLLNVSVNLRVS